MTSFWRIANGILGILFFGMAVLFAAIAVVTWEGFSATVFWSIFDAAAMLAMSILCIVGVVDPFGSGRSAYGSDVAGQIFTHMTPSEKSSAMWRGGLYGLWVAATVALPLGNLVRDPSGLSVLVAVALLILHIACVPLWWRWFKRKMCATQWAKEQGYAPEDIDLRPSWLRRRKNNSSASGSAPSSDSSAALSRRRGYIVMIGVLVIGNFIMAIFLARSLWIEDLWRQEVFGIAAMAGSVQADADFRRGERRIYELVEAEEDVEEEFTGRHEGPFEVWQKLYYPALSPPDHYAMKRYVKAYNSRMRHLHEHPEEYGLEE